MLIRNGHKKVRVVIISGRSLHKILRGDCGGTVANPTMNWSLIVLIDFYDFLVWCMFGGISRRSILLLRNYCFTVAGQSLSIMWIFCLLLCSLKCVRSFVVVNNCSDYHLILTTYSSIEL